MKKIITVICFVLLCVGLNSCAVYTVDDYPSRTYYHTHSVYYRPAAHHHHHHGHVHGSKPMPPSPKPKPHYRRPQPKPTPHPHSRRPQTKDNHSRDKKHNRR